MIIILPKNHTYKLGNDFPLLSVPMDAGNKQEGCFDDFQWWALSKDFQKWLSEHPRQWTAESYQLPSYDRLNDYLKENFNLPVWENLQDKTEKVLNFQGFSNLSEAEGDQGQKETQEDDIKKAVKLHFAYNKLKSEGKLQETLIPSNLTENEEQAVFLVAEDAETGKNLTETLKAFKMKATVKPTESGSKIELVNVTEMVPGGVIKDEDTPQDTLQKMIQSGIALGTAGLVGGGLYSIIKYGGSAIGGMMLMKSLSGYKRNAPAGVNATANSLKGGAKTLWGGIKNIGKFAKDAVTLKNTRQFAKEFMAFKTAGATTGNAVKGAFGVMKAGGSTAGKLIPFVGEVLMVIDAVGSLWNWYSDNQAPKFSEVESFAHNELDPKKIPIGVPITICWCQPAQSTFGAIMSFFSSNDTRTTAEIIKIQEKEGKSVFILTQVNSKSLQKQLAEHDLILIYLDNSDVVNDQGGFINTVTRIFDNEDLDFEISYVDGLNDIASLLNFQGVCDWDEFMAAYKEAPDQLIVTNPEAPAEYQFYYKDPDGDIINVSGKLVPSSEFKNTDAQKLSSIFFPSEDKSFQSKYTQEEREEKAEERLERAEESFSLSSQLLSVINESGIITNFNKFGQSLEMILKEEEKESSKQTPLKTGATTQKEKSNPNEGADDEDSKTSAGVALTSDDLSTPAQVMVYYVTSKQYADPSLRKYQMRGSKFTNFLIDEEDIKARDGEGITVDVNTVGGVNPIDPKRGVYEFKEDEEEKEEKEDIETRRVKTQAEVEDEEEDKDLDLTGLEDEEKEPVVVSPKDVKIKDRKNKIVIRDKTVGDGVNILDEFMTDSDKEKMGISDWKAVTYAKGKKNRKGEIDQVILRNKYAPLGDRSRRYSVTDGSKFELAKKFVEEVDDRIKYE